MFDQTVADHLLHSYHRHYNLRELRQTHDLGNWFYEELNQICASILILITNNRSYSRVMTGDRAVKFEQT